MKLQMTLAAMALAATPALAQDSGTAAPAELQEAARSYVDSQAMQTTLDQLLSTDAFIAQIQAGGMQLDDEDTRTLAEIVDEEFGVVRPELEEAMTVAAADAFTMEELEALNEFYASEEGRSIAEKTTPFMQGFYQEIGPTLRQTQEQIAMRARDALAPGAAGDGTAPGTATE
jgi:uncharacterized protein